MGTSVYTDHHLLQDLHLPPRKLLSPTAAYHADSDDPYSSDDFRMYEFKIRRCTRSRSHDWTECPFAHPGEKASRRDPRKNPYSASVCPDFRRSGSCPRGDACGFAHGVFEAWLHPSRYRTESCKDGPRCPRKVCFFAHSPSQLRLAPATAPHGKNGHFTKSSHCCMHSPRSTLSSAASVSSPPSPASYKAAALLERLVGLFGAVSFKDGGGSPHGGLWVDGQDPLILPPSTPRSFNLRGSVDNYCFDVSPCSSYKGTSEIEERVNYVNGANGWADPDLGWVDDLLM